MILHHTWVHINALIVYLIKVGVKHTWKASNDDCITHGIEGIITCCVFKAKHSDGLKLYIYLQSQIFHVSL